MTAAKGFILQGLEAGHQKYYVFTELPPIFREEFHQQTLSRLEHSVGLHMPLCRWGPDVSKEISASFCTVIHHYSWNSWHWRRRHTSL